MKLLLCLWLAGAGSPDPVSWNELTLSIEEDRGTSSDRATLCRIRVTNHGQSTWQGRDIVFEARAFRDGRVAARQKGRFGLTLGPRETLETLVGFLGRFDRFEVGPIAASSRGRVSAGGKAKKRARATRSRSPRRGEGKRGRRSGRWDIRVLQLPFADS